MIYLTLHKDEAEDCLARTKLKKIGIQKFEDSMVDVLVDFATKLKTFKSLPGKHPLHRPQRLSYERDEGFIRRLI